MIVGEGRVDAAEPDAAPEPTASGGSLPHEPALDGLRGLAVAAVVLFHLGRLRGGFLGVDLFFVLSGFLITSLLTDEWRRRGTIDLVRFWARRARRLLPALFVLLAGVSVLLLALTPAAERGRFRGDGIATLLYVANWHRVGSAASYWDMFAQPSPFDHTWSLAIEEQFYLVWPLVFLGGIHLVARRAGLGLRAGLRALAVATLGLAVVSFVLLAALYDGLSTNRAYYGTDTRVGAILLGALLAFGLRLWGSRRRAARGAWVLDGAGLAALAFLAWSVARVSGVEAWYYRGGLLAFGLATLLVMLVCIGDRRGPVARLLSFAPLQALGRISYGVYLWHWPVIVYLTPERVPLDGLALDGLRVVVTLAAAHASAAFVEQPIRAGAVRGLPARVATSVALVICAVGVVAATAPDRSAEAAATGATGGMPDATAPITTASAPTNVPTGSLKILMVGDSGPIFLGPELKTVAEAAGATVLTQGEHGCSILFPEAVSRTDAGLTLHTPPGCERRSDRWRGIVRRYDPDVVVYYLAHGGEDGHRLLDGEWVADCDPSYDRYLRGQLLTEVDLLADQGARVVLATTPDSRTRDDATAEETARGADCRAEVYRAVAAERPESRVLDLNAFVARAEAEGPSLRQDFVHFSPEGARTVAAWLVPELEATAPAPPA